MELQWIALSLINRGFGSAIMLMLRVPHSILTLMEQYHYTISLGSRNGNKCFRLRVKARNRC